MRTGVVEGSGVSVTHRQTHYPVATLQSYQVPALINPNACHMRTGAVEGSGVSVTHRQTDTLSSCNHYKANSTH